MHDRMTFKQYLIIERFVAEEGDLTSLDESKVSDWLKKLSGKLETDAEKAKRLSKEFYDRKKAEKEKAEKAGGTIKPQGTHQARARMAPSAAAAGRAAELEYARELEDRYGK